MADQAWPNKQLRSYLRQGIYAGFERHGAHPTAPGLRAVIEASIDFLDADQGREAVLGQQGLVRAVLIVGQNPSTTPHPNAANWLSDAIRQQKGNSVQSGQYQAIPSEVINALVFTPDVDNLLAFASKICLETQPNTRFSLRHLVVAMLISASDDISGLNGLQVEQLDQIRHDVIGRIIENAEPDEDPEAWLRYKATEPWLYLQSPQKRPRQARRPTGKGGKRPPPPPPPPPDPKSESLRTLTDLPASIDLLNREAFAGALANSLRDGRKLSDGCAFAIHLHGPWGSGKSTVLNFLKEDLTNPDPAKQTPPWLVVEYNAWQHQRRRPPWWSLVQALYAHKPAKALDGSMRRWWLMTWWRLRTDWIVPLTVAAIAICGGTTIWLASDVAAKLFSGAVTAGIALIVAVIGGQRWLVFGSSTAAETYKQQASDPNKRLVDLYQNYVASLGKRKPPNDLAHDRMPIAIFIDDLDRCDGTYVVELLEGIQTLMRDAPVAFVIAADRRWICTAFEQHYSSFAEPIGEPGRPLGYLFLDKLFQISAGLPALSAQQRSRYWDHLLDSGAPAPVAAASEQVDKLAAASGLVAKQAVIDAAPVEQQAALRAVAVEQSFAPEAQKQLEHRLRPFAALLEPNPRSMKRLVNAVAIARARCILEGRSVGLEPLARWTIIELRWPLVAAWLAEAPERIGKLGTAKARAALAPPPAIASVLTAPSFVASLGTMKAEDLQAIVD